MQPQLSVAQEKRTHNFSKSKGIWPYLKFPQLKGHCFERMGESQRLMSCSQKSQAGSDVLTAGMLKEMALQWFTETQAALILQNGRLPEWFHGFVTRKEAESVLKDRNIGHFLIRLSDRAFGYILSYKGNDRCRHFVIQQLKNGRYTIDGSTHSHRSLAALINYYTTEVIQPFGEVLTQSCSQDDRCNLYDQVYSPTKPSFEETEREPVSRQPLFPNHSQSEEGSQRPPAVPPKANRILNTRRLTSSLESMSSNSEDSDPAPPLPLRASMVFEQDRQDGATYGRVNKLKYKEQQAPPVLSNKRTSKESLANPLYSLGLDIRKSQSSEKQSQLSSVVYSLAIEPQPIYNEAFEPPDLNPSTDVVYAEVDMKQWKIGAMPAASGNSYATIAASTEHSSQASNAKQMSLTTPPLTPPRLSPNLNQRLKSASPTRSPQKHKVSQKPLANIWPVCHSAEHSQAKDQPYDDTLGKKNSTSCPENTYEQIPEEFSKRGQAKPVTAEKEEVRKKWFSDWKYK
ncbi:SH2 domain-containing protein 7-like [Hemiscyllium ocellatum]|uniref:SH2 domain-containing protein 7-like n=1 Tax=Hemiscyllium ocellatum TaxID=170820 RepID=UPI002967600F|nr:SH2 domain-containing protein 7-like [Hemiscyllium ocellatum]